MVSGRYRILFVLTPALHLNNGGVQMTTCKLGSYFSAKGHEVFAYSFTQAGHAYPKCISLLPAIEVGGVGAQGNIDQLGSLIKQIEPDIVINNMPYDRCIGEVLSRRGDYFLIGCLRNTLFSVKGDLDSYIGKVIPNALEPFFRNRIGRWGLLRHHRHRHRKDLERILDTYDLFVMFGPPNLQELAYFVPDYNSEKIELIPNSIPAVVDHLPDKDKRLLWLGRVATSQKRADLIPAIWRLVNQELPDWQLDIVGEGPDLQWIKDEVRRLGLPRVNFYGRQEPDLYYSRSSLFFMTSAFEGFPNTLIEAQSYGCVPVVFDSYPVASWLLDQGRSGILVPPFDCRGMASVIVELASGTDLGAMARQTMESARRFEIDKVGAMWERLFDLHVSGIRRSVA